MDNQPEIDLEVVGYLLALMAHDLRNPLSALHSNIGFLNTVLQVPDEDVAEALSDGLVSCDGLSHIIDNLDLFGQTLRSAKQAAGAPFSVVGLIRDVVHRCEQVAASHGLELKVEYEAIASGMEAWGNRDLMARALGNLVRNSLQLAPTNSLVEIRATEGDEFVDVYVLDQGVTLERETDHVSFSARGQIGAKGSGVGRYSRGMGLMCARLAACATKARVASSLAPDGYSNAFRLTMPKSTPEQT